MDLDKDDWNESNEILGPLHLHLKQLFEKMYGIEMDNIWCEEKAEIDFKRVYKDFDRLRSNTEPY